MVGFHVFCFVILSGGDCEDICHFVWPPLRVHERLF